MWKVMIADDEMYMLEALEKLIDWKSMDCSLIFKAQNGKQLIERMKIEVPDIVITDIKMPLVDGMEVAKYVYERKLNTKVIILSAYADFEYAREAIQYEVCGYIVKTSAIESLPEMIQKAIQKRKEASLLSEEEREIEDSQSEDIFNRLQKYVEKHYMDKLTLSTISKEIHANGSYLSRLYKEKTGHTLFDVINQKKLEKAKEYLSEGKRVSEVAVLVGFEDVSYFSRVFKKYEGCSPREYEKK